MNRCDSGGKYYKSGVLEDAKPAIYRVNERCGQISGGPSTGIVVRTAVEPASEELSSRPRIPVC